MNKQEFLARLREGLSGLPEDDIAERLTFYAEMIDDRVEDGLSEQAAVAEIGPVDAVVSQIIADTPLPAIVRRRVDPGRRLRAWEIVLLVLGFPLWFPLLIAGFAVLLAGYLVIWAVILSVWAVEVSLAAACLGCIAAAALFIWKADVPQGLLMLSAGLVLAGASIAMFFGCKAVTRGTFLLTKKLASGIKTLLLRKEHA